MDAVRFLLKSEPVEVFASGSSMQLRWGPCTPFMPHFAQLAGQKGVLRLELPRTLGRAYQPVEGYCWAVALCTLCQACELVGLQGPVPAQQGVGTGVPGYAQRLFKSSRGAIRAPFLRASG
jgi:hypothetical protein